MVRKKTSSGEELPSAGNGKRQRVAGRPKRKPRRRKAGPNSNAARSTLPGERLQKVMAGFGVASRRGAERLILEGEVTINGRLAKLGDRVEVEDSIKVGSKLLQRQAPPQALYLALHKPEGTMTTRNDPEGRSTVFDIIPRRFQRGLLSVGRLDYGTEGLLLLTTDGEFAQRVAHPRYQCTKTYLVKVKGIPDEKSIERLAKGIRLDGVRLRPAKITAHRVGGKGGNKRTAKRNTWWKVELTEGRTRQVRRMFERIGHIVTRLRRVQVGPVSLGKLGKGELRELTDREVGSLMAQKI